MLKKGRDIIKWKSETMIESLKVLLKERNTLNMKKVKLMVVFITL